MGKTRISARELFAIVSIASCAFVFNTSEFMPIGLLVDISADFGITEAEGGVLITAYAWAVLILSVPLMLATTRFSFRPLLLAVVVVFGAGQVLSTFATGFWTLMGARLVVACAHSIFWAIASPIAVRAVSPEHQPVALSAIITGSAIAQILGLPIGRMVGLALGWRASFACVAVVTLLVLACLFFAIPKMPCGEPFRVRQLPGLLTHPVLAATFVVTAVAVTGYYTGYSYIEPFLQQVAYMSDEAITAALVVFGIAGIFGSFLFARCYVGTRRRYWFIRISLAGLALALALMVPAAASGQVAVYAAFVLWGICGVTFDVALQAEILKYAPQEGSAVAMAVFSGIFNLGIGGGSAVGGAASVALGMPSVCYVGAAFGVASVIVTCVFLIPAMHRTKHTV